MSTETPYRRRVPAEWPELVDFAERQMSQAGAENPTTDNVNAVWDAAKEIENEPLERARYYGLGLAMCGLARQIRHEETKARIINDAAKGIIFRRTIEGAYAKDSLTIDDLKVEAIFSAFDSPVQRSVASLTRGERLAIDTLGVESYKREMWLVLGKPSDNLIKEYRNDIASGDWTKQVLRNNAAAGMISVLRTAIIKKRESDTLASSWNVHKASLAEITGGTALADLIPESLAIKSATLRRDEFIRDLSSYIDVKDGRGVFNRNATSRVIDLAVCGTDQNTVLHQSRLKCPALSVQGLVPDIAEIVVQAVEQAQEQMRKPLH